MGNSSSTRNVHDESVDYGCLTPQGVYTGTQDWNHSVVSQLIIERRLAPFYRPLDDYDDSWDDDQVLAARKDFPSPDPSNPPLDSPSHPPPPAPLSRASSKHSRQTPSKEINRLSEAQLYRGAVECPICFLYFPSNINHSRCCNHPICTECFVQIKRSEPSPTHLASDPACCPYCVQEHFGVTYTPPPWRSGIGSENNPRIRPEAVQAANEQRPDTVRRKSLSPDNPEVVTIDQIRPDWEAKLAAMRAVVQRRANRRIIMRQVGDRLIPVGITSGRIHPIGQDFPNNEQGDDTPRGSRRRRGGGNSGPGVDLGQFLGLNGQDIEELMVMEAMRLSLAEHEEAQRRQNTQSNNTEGGSNQPPPRDDGGHVDSPHATPISFVLSQRHLSPSQAERRNGRTTPDDAGADGLALLRPPSVSSPLAQAASAIALGLGLPSGSSANGRASSRTPSPRPPSRSTERRTSTETSRPSSTSLAEEATERQLPGVDVALSDHPPVRSAEADKDAADLPSEGKSTGSNVSTSTSMNVPASYKALPSTPEDSLAGQPLLDDTDAMRRPAEET